MKDLFKKPLELNDIPALEKPDRSVIPPFSVTSTPFSVYQVNPGITTQPQNEPSVRINRKNKKNMVAAFRDFRLGSSPAIRNIALSSTSDGGVTWNDQLATFRYMDRHSDPSVGVDTAGNFYVVTLDYYNPNSNSRNALSLRKSTDGGSSWLDPVVAVDTTLYSFHDREILAVDDGKESPNSGNAYVSWTEFGGTGGIQCVASVDGGASFLSPVKVSVGTNVQGSMPITGPNGELYVVWTDFTSPNQVMFAKSTDAGASFGANVVVSDLSHQPTDFMYINGGIESFGYAVAAVDKTPSTRRGTIYVTWQSLAYGDVDVLCSKSTDGGTTWSPAVRVNNDSLSNGRDQFHQWVTVDDSGWVDVVFLDRRNDPSNILADAYFAQSRDGGVSFKNYRLTAQNFDPRINYNADVRIGDYSGIDGALGMVAMVWADTHLGNQDIFLSPIGQSKNGTISGIAYDDINGDSVKESNEHGIAGIKMYLAREANLDSVITDSSGTYTFRGLFPGTYIVSESLPQLYNATEPAPGFYSITIHDTETVANKNFGNLITGGTVIFSGWNLLSLPKKVPDGRKSVVFPYAASGAFAYTEGYIQKDTLVFGTGYWLKFSNTQHMSVMGDSVINDSISVHAGWNLIGTLTVPVPVASISSTPSGIMSSHFFGYSGSGYRIADTLNAGEGYWIKVSGDGELKMSPGAISSPITSRRVQTEKLNTIEISGNNGHSQILYFGIGIDNSSAITASDLPPKPPAGIFDVRFGSQRTIELIDPTKIIRTTLPIEIQSNAASLHITWNINQDGIRYRLVETKSGKNIAGGFLQGAGEADVENIPMMLSVEPALATKDIPSSFSLDQNYPNPFNPSTIITYNLAQPTFVRLRIFNVLGQEVSTLVNDWQLASTYSVTLDASKLASGVYYYSLETKEFTSSKKMMLIR
ncbi:MAG: SdrD B-like domain-containing protein [Bacteroidota bacterium]